MECCGHWNLVQGFKVTASTVEGHAAGTASSLGQLLFFYHGQNYWKCFYCVCFWLKTLFATEK